MFDLDIVNQRLLAYNFGYIDAQNIPSPIRLDTKGNKIGQKAAQAWCLIQHLPVIIGDLITSAAHKKYWELLVQLLEIMRLVFSRQFSEVGLDELNELIFVHHKTFPENRLIPKHHFMIYYAFVIRR